MKTKLAIAALVLSAVSANAQNVIKYLTIGSGNQVSTTCTDEGKVIQDVISLYPHKDNWTWIVACNEQDWTLLARHLGVQTNGVIYAETDRRAHITYVHGFALTHPTRDYDVSAEHVIAHELCHIYLDSPDEIKVDKLASQWIVERNKSIVASK